MRIVYTGFAGRHAKADTTKTTIFEVSDTYRMVRDLVDRELDVTTIEQPWEFGDPIPSADLYVMDMLTPATWTSAANTLQMLHLMATSAPILFLYTDWHIHGVQSGIAGLANEGAIERRVESNFFRRIDGGPIDSALLHRELPALQRAAHTFATSWKPQWSAMIPIHKFGRLDMLRPYVAGASPDQIFAYDVSAEIDRLLPPAPPAAVRTPAWVVASLINQKAWVARRSTQEMLSWPIVGFGRWAKNRVHESVIIKALSEHTGSISVPHAKHPGSGWQRARHVSTAKMGAVNLLGAKDREIFGPPFQYDSHEYESMTQSQLRAVAYDQYTWLMSQVDTYDTLVSTVIRAITHTANARTLT